MFKKSHQLTGALLVSSINNGEIDSGSGKTNKKSAKFYFINVIWRIEKSCFIISSTGQAFTQLNQVVKKILIC